MRAQNSLQRQQTTNGSVRGCTMAFGSGCRALPVSMPWNCHLPHSHCTSTAHTRPRHRGQAPSATASLTVTESYLQEKVTFAPSSRPTGSSAAGPTPASQLSSQQQGPSSAATTAPAASQRWRRLSSTALAGGELHVVQWEGRRNLRVWLPPGYSRDEARRHPWPVLYCNDGQNVFGDCATLSGHSWRVAHTAAELISTGRLPPFLVVGLDHAGPLRSLEYTPYTPGTGPGGFRCDAAQWPGGGVSAYLARLQQEVLPWVAAEYGASLQPADLALAGSSFGGVAALAAGMCGHSGEGCGFGALLVESPSMWIAEEAFLRDIQTYNGPWPQRVYLGMGGKEYSGVRGGRGAEHDAHFPRYLKALYAALTEQGLGPDRLAWTYDPTAAHTEQAWADRLHEALCFIGAGWWANWLKRQTGSRLLTAPYQLCAGVEGQLLFFNRTASNTLSHLPRGSSLKVCMGVDGWQQTQQHHLQPLWCASAALTHHIPPPAALQQEVFQSWGLDPKLQEHLHQRLLDTVQGHSSSSSRNNSSTRAAAEVHDSVEGDDWYVLSLPPPPVGCSRLDMAFCDGDEKVWDNNDRQDHHLAVSPQPHGTGNQQQHTGAVARGATASSRGGGTIAAAALTAASMSTPSSPAANSPKQGSLSSRAVAAQGPAATVLRMLDSLRSCAIGDGCGFISADALDRAEVAVLHGANAPAQGAAAAAEAAGQQMFLMPQQPVAGLPVSLYVNKAQLQEVLMRAPNMCLQIGFNNWSTGVQKVSFRPTALPRNDRHDWWCCRVDVPHEAQHGAYAICGVFNGCESWDNNQGADYKVSVMCLEAAVVRAVASACIGLDAGSSTHAHAGAHVDQGGQRSSSPFKVALA